MGKLIKNDVPAGIFRIRMNPSANSKKLPVLIECSVETKGKYPSKEEFDTFETVENQVEKMESASSFQLFACITTSGKKEWLYYAKESSAAKLIGEKFVRLRAKIEVSPDPDWNAYGGYTHLLDKHR